jgi:hypothetical protein
MLPSLPSSGYIRYYHKTGPIAMLIANSLLVLFALIANTVLSQIVNEFAPETIIESLNFLPLLSSLHLPDPQNKTSDKEIHVADGIAQEIAAAWTVFLDDAYEVVESGFDVSPMFGPLFACRDLLHFASVDFFARNSEVLIAARSQLFVRREYHNIYEVIQGFRGHCGDECPLQPSRPFREECWAIGVRLVQILGNSRGIGYDLARRCVVDDGESVQGLSITGAGRGRADLLASIGDVGVLDPYGPERKTLEC